MPLIPHPMHEWALFGVWTPDSFRKVLIYVFYYCSEKRILSRCVSVSTPHSNVVTDCDHL